jgi:predicted metalloenzyme YecM
MFLQNYTQFIDEIYQRLSNFGINTDEIKIDHLGYQASSKEDYDQKVEALKDLAEEISENMVEGRRVGIFKLNDPLEYKETPISIIEIIDPKEGQEVESYWEHIEFLLDSALEKFMAEHPTLEWNDKAIDREEFPMLILSLGDGLRAKFPRRGVLEEIERQKSLA